MMMKERWINEYSSGHNILLVGEGDFSFSLSLAMDFASATNIVATTLDSYDELMKKYKNSRANVAILKSLGATLFYGVDATNMANLADMRWRKFDRIIYNFPHAGFLGHESNPHLITAMNIDKLSNFWVRLINVNKKSINMHRNLVRGFLENARSLLWADGEVHINHKITAPFDTWRIEDIASDCSLQYVGRDRFDIKDFPWYRNKRGSGWRSDEAFPLGACRTFKFKAHQHKKRKRDPMTINGFYAGECTRYGSHRHCGEISFEVRRSILHRRIGRGRKRSLLITRAF